MPKATGANFINFDRGILNITKKSDKAQMALPKMGQLITPSDAKVEIKLKDLWQAKSLENTLHNAMMPQVKNLDDLTPSMYKKRLMEAKEEFKKRVKEKKEDQQGGGKKKRGRQETEEEILEKVIEDLEELEKNQELLWMLRQVVHIA